MQYLNEQILNANSIEELREAIGILSKLKSLFNQGVAKVKKAYGLGGDLLPFDKNVFENWFVPMVEQVLKDAVFDDATLNNKIYFESGLAPSSVGSKIKIKFKIAGFENWLTCLFISKIESNYVNFDIGLEMDENAIKIKEEMEKVGELDTSKVKQYELFDKLEDLSDTQYNIPKDGKMDFGSIKIQFILPSNGKTVAPKGADEEITAYDEKDLVEQTFNSFYGEIVKYIQQKNVSKMAKDIARFEITLAEAKDDLLDVEKVIQNILDQSEEDTGDIEELLKNDPDLVELLQMIDNVVAS